MAEGLLAPRDRTQEAKKNVILSIGIYLGTMETNYTSELQSLKIPILSFK